MECLSCSQPTEPASTTMFRGRILMCYGCNELAEKAQKELEVDIKKMELRALEWLEQHILNGGLLTGGDGYQKHKPSARVQPTT